MNDEFLSMRAVNIEMLSKYCLLKWEVKMRMQNGITLGLLGAAVAVMCLASLSSGVEIVVNVDFENLPAVSVSETQTGQGAFYRYGRRVELNFTKRRARPL